MALKTFHFQIVTPERVVFEDDIEQVSIPTSMGEITVLHGHIPLVALLAPGAMRILKEGKETLLAVSGGMIYVTKQKIVVLADTAERAEELDEKRAEEARERARQMMTEKRFDAEEYAKLSVLLEKELARLRVAKKHRTRHTHSPETIQ